MNLARDVWHLFQRHVRNTRRMPAFLIVGIVQPVLWMALFSQLFGRITLLPGFEIGSYVQFLAPGIAVMSSLFGSGYAGIGLLVDLERGAMDRMLATPVSRVALIAARVLTTAVTVLLQGAIILAVAAGLGARPRRGALSVAMVLAAAALLGAGMGAFSNFVALLTRRQETLFALMNFTLLPLTFLSSMIMSRFLMPAWIRTAAEYNPVNWAVMAARNGFEGRDWAASAAYLTYLALFATAASALATLAFRRYRAGL
jgi:ABC-2 type transport system permease protein